MPATVYDTTVVAYANGTLAGRVAGNVLDKRLCALEEFLLEKTTAWYNDKLLNEYKQKIRENRNDVIESFLIRLEQHGRRSARSTLSRQDHRTAKDAGWPSHDQHVLAAALEPGNSTVFVTEDALAKCRRAIKRAFGVKVRQL